ncbi:MULTISPECIES: LacI family DNA-binding transcriptional regulator [unclassified Sphingomonas]|nr:MULTISPECIES: LacI family DNA-binding transcriptional regulator [unclassified Sphingomonas]
MADRQRRTTIVDVARAVGVSAKSVSRVLNGEPNVSPDLRDRVREAARSLNYHPNALAQALVRRRSYLLGLVYENPSPSYSVELQLGALDRLKDERYHLVSLPIRSVREHADEVVPLLRAAALDGVILAPPASDHPTVLDALDAVQLPYARIASTTMLERGPSIVLDDVEAARTIAEHVIGHGHRRIGIIKGNPAHPSSMARTLGYTQAMAGAGIELRTDWVEQGFYTFESGYEAAQRLLARADRPTAILVQNDEMAVGALMAARELGLALPEQLSIVGFDDSEVSRVAWPRLTTIRQPVYDMAVSAVDVLIRQLSGEPSQTLTAHRFELLVRDSVGPPPPANGQA